jgi:hypothetical protein
MKSIFIYLLPLLILASCSNEPQPPPGESDSTAPKKGQRRSSTGHKRIYVNKGSDNGLSITGGVTAGDTVVFRASLSPFSWVYVNNLQGTKEDSIVFINEGGIVKLTAGFDFHNCQYIKVTGSGTADKFGFYINQAKNGQMGGGVGINIADKSAHFLLERFAEDSLQYGSWAKNEHFCDSSLSQWVLDGIEVRDFKMTNLDQHGFYYGATEPENKTRPSSCGGVNKFYNPSRLANIRIHDGVIHNVGKNGVMVNLAMTGTNEIFNMDIDSTGNQLQQDQGTGIAVGYSNIYVHDNRVKNTWLWGIAAFGGSVVKIERNKVDSSGWNALNKRRLNWPQNIRISTVSPDSTTFQVSDNILSNPGTDVPSIEVFAGALFTKKNVVCNNKNPAGAMASLRIDPTVIYQNCPSPPQPPAVTVYEKFYRVVSGKRKYYTLYSDGTYELKK